MKLNFCVPCLLGVEALIAREAASFGAGDVVSENGKVFFSGGFELLDLGLHRRLDHAVAQVLLFIDLHALDGGLDIRQSIHLPGQNQH